MTENQQPTAQVGRSNYKPKNWKKTFVLIFSGQSFSLIGSSAVQFAIIWWLTIKSGSATTLAWAGIGAFLPQAILGPFAGVWVDRFKRKTMMMLADSFVAVCSLVLAVVFFIQEPHYSFVYLILFLRGIGGVFHTPAMQAAIPLLVPENQLMRVGGWTQFIQSGCFMIGPVFGAAMMAALPLWGIMVVDIIGAVIAVGSLALIKIPELPHDPTKIKVMGELKAALKIIVNDKALIAVSLPVLLSIIFYMPTGSLLPLMINGYFGGGAWEGSLVEFVFAGGMLISSLFIGIVGGKNRFLMISTAMVALGLVMLIAGLLPATAFVWFVVLSALMGVTGNFYSIPYIAYVQSTVDPAALGRVMSLLISLMALSTPVGLVIAGPVAEAIGVNTWFWLSGLFIMLSGVICYITTRKHKQAGMVAD